MQLVTRIHAVCCTMPCIFLKTVMGMQCRLLQHAVLPLHQYSSQDNSKMTPARCLLSTTHHQVESSMAVQSLKPRIDMIKARYGDDQKKIKRETDFLYQQAGVNPLAGGQQCFRLCGSRAQQLSRPVAAAQWRPAPQGSMLSAHVQQKSEATN